MNNAEVLCHSSGPWKKHKYFQKIGEGANAVYKYAKNADKNITGSAYKKEAKDEKERAEYANELAGTGTKDYNYGANVDNVKNGRAKGKFATGQQWSDSAAYHGRKAAEAQSNYYNKSLFGKSEKAAKKSVARGERILKKFFSSETKKTVKDTFTGKTRTPKQTGNDIVNIKKLAKKNG